MDMVGVNVCRYLCLLLALNALTGFSVVHASKYLLQGGGIFELLTQKKRQSELSKLFTYKGTFYPKNDATKKTVATEVKISVVGLNQHQQEIKVFFSGIKWTAFIKDGQVTEVRLASDKKAELNIAQAGYSLASMVDRTHLSGIEPLMVKIYHKCLTFYNTAVSQNVSASFRNECVFVF